MEIEVGNGGDRYGGVLGFFLVCMGFWIIFIG